MDTYEELTKSSTTLQRPKIDMIIKARTLYYKKKRERTRKIWSEAILNDLKEKRIICLHKHTTICLIGHVSAISYPITDCFFMKPVKVIYTRTIQFVSSVFTVDYLIALFM
ncbi:hypothetical protein Zmor_002190 [Zophobas morio]|uniref:Uncharacterized protein n=1 Tax=Zophobas morio TaxID=2755281 RepID=A0AA38MTA3_9CUCU|nr:hypothetical protein Zmor_002190 [Zophobas morio]